MQAWDPTPPAVSADVDESSVSDSGTIIADEPSGPDLDPIRMTTEPSDELPLKDKLPVPVLEKLPADPVVKVLGKSFVGDPVKVTDPFKVSDKSPDVPMPASSTPLASQSPLTLRLKCSVLASPRLFNLMDFPTLVTLVTRNETLRLRLI